eukprot:TRINITY_DN97671_c0_g1_i1.p6 TRINITY_DN97671_c0_g1~~TRINITY_DN97671_c0_g1_i1.p6  ORF type:complete len:101 (+),score=4.15 TRINITY_DN97671_c0_g1_i1:147-449(+)
MLLYFFIIEINFKDFHRKMDDNKRITIFQIRIYWIHLLQKYNKAKISPQRAPRSCSERYPIPCKDEGFTNLPTPRYARDYGDRERSDQREGLRELTFNEI